MSELGFERAQAAETGRPGYDPRGLLKLYLYGDLNQIRSSRRLGSFVDRERREWTRPFCPILRLQL
jgi:transposase